MMGDPHFKSSYGSRYYLVAMRRGEWPNPWIWEFFHRGKPLAVRIWGGYFKAHDAAIVAGQPALVAFLNVARGD